MCPRSNLANQNNFSRVIWLGDLNYRIGLSYEEAIILLENSNWESLLEKDQVCWLSH